MRVVLATDARTAGGVGRHLADLAAGLSRRGVTVGIAAPSGSELAATAADLGLDFTAYGSELDRPDIWHLHLADTYDRDSLALLWRARGNARRVVITEHLPRSNASDRALTGDSRTPGAATAKSAFKRTQFGLAHSVIAVSEASRQFLISRYHVSHRRVTTIHNGIDLERFRPAPPPAETAATPLVVAVGSLIRQKGHDVLIRAAAMATADWRVVIAGDGPHRNTLAALARTVGGQRVELRGWVDDVPELMRRAAVVCMPSRWESFCYVPLEAMAMARPVVASRVDGVDEAVTHERHGLLVDPDDPAGLAVALDRLIEDRDYAEKLGRQGSEDVAAFGLDHMIEATLEHYRSLL